MIYAYFLLAFVLTEAIECTLMFLIYRSKQFVYYVFLCNLLTNPALNLITLEIGHTFGLFWHNIALIISELTVIFVEGCILSRLCNLAVKKSLIVSAVLNTVSFGSGFLIIKLFIKL